MEPNLQRRIQRYGWDLAADTYESLWQAQLADARQELLACAALARGERVLDVACGTGLVSFLAAAAVGPEGRVLGTDLSGRMVDAAGQRAGERGVVNVEFARMDAEQLALPDCAFDVALCALGLMYMPDPLLALREMRRVLRPRGRIAVAVWGDRSRCGWSRVLPIVEAEVRSDVCPLFFRLGQRATLARVCADAGFAIARQRRIAATLLYADAEEACDAALVGGPVALAWSRFEGEVRSRVRSRYKEAIEEWRRGARYEIPGEFVVVTGVRMPDGSA